MRLLTTAVLLLATVVVASPAAAADDVVSDDWYAIYVNDTKAGHARTQIARRNDASPGGVVWITETSSRFRLSRLGQEVQLFIRTSIEEDARGRVRRFYSAQVMSETEVVTEGLVSGKRIHLSSGDVKTTVDYPAGALGPHAVDAKVRLAGYEKGVRTAAPAFSTDSPSRAAQMTFSMGGREPRSILGRRIVLVRCDVSNSRSAARTSAMWLDRHGTMLESIAEVPGIGRLRMVKAERAIATTLSSPAEIFANALVAPDRGIPSPRRSTRLVLRLARKSGAAFGTTIPAEGAQRVRPDGDRAVLVTVQVRNKRPESVFPRPVPATGRSRWLSATPYLEIADEEVRRHAAAAVGDSRDAFAAAARIERYVRAHVDDKGYDVGFATAAEVARRKEGDCTEHAVLSAALARASGLPSRVVAGLVYLPGMSTEGVGPRGAFGYHMWAEVLVAEGVWRPVDAALGGFDATHIALGRSDLALESPLGDLVLPLLETIRDLTIEVVEVR